MLDVHGWLGPKVEPGRLDAELNAHGADGWELVAVFDINHGHGTTAAIVATFKRVRD